MTSAPGRERAPIRPYPLAVTIAVASVVVDAVTKRWASSTFTAEPVQVLGDFLRVRFVENTGAAFSMFQGAGPFFGLAAAVAIVAVFWFLRNARNRWEVVGLALVMGGAAGNLVDRIFRGDGFLDGPVIDWIDLWRIPTFNIADASITIAVVVLLIGSWAKD